MSTGVRCVATLVVVQLLLLCFVSAKTPNETWNILTLQQQWPPGIQVDLNETRGPPYNITPVVKSWVIHGLWPSYSGTKGPDNCNSSWKFNYTKVAPLRKELDSLWPNLFANFSAEKFWAHEWEKHGTCGTSLPALADERHYFSKAMEMARNLDLLRNLSANGIDPATDKLYKKKDIESALLKLTGEKKVIIDCIFDKYRRQNIFYAVTICVDKKFKPVSCIPIHRVSRDIHRNYSSIHNECTHQKTGDAVLYPPITYP